MVIVLYKSSASTLTFIYLFCQDKYLAFFVFVGKLCLRIRLFRIIFWLPPLNLRGVEELETHHANSLCS
jgi:hypothetical protein